MSEIVEEAVVEAAEATAEALTETAEVIEKGAPGFARFLGDSRVHILAALVVGAAAGSFVTYKVVKPKLELKYSKISEQEIEGAREYYRSMGEMKEREKSYSPEELLAQLHEEEREEAKAAGIAMKQYSGEKAEDVEVEADVITTQEIAEEKIVKRNIFNDPRPSPQELLAQSGWDYETELRIRDENPTRPYIISEEEYLEGEKEYDQSSLTYFEGDGVLTDEKDEPIPNADELVGDDNLMRFGHGADTQDMLFVRNDRVELDFEITRSGGKYTVEVLGFEDEDSLRHSSSRPRRFRVNDE